MDFDEVKQSNKGKTAVAVKPDPAKLMPKAILYDATTGVPTNAQDVRDAEAQSTDIVEVPWKQWLGGRAAQTLPEKGDAHGDHPNGALFAPYPWPPRDGSNRCQHRLGQES